MIEQLKNVKYIQCYKHCSFAINEEGNVYSWGSSKYQQLGHSNLTQILLPKLVEINGIQSVCLSPYNTYFLNLQDEIYFCGYQYLSPNLSKPVKLSEHKFYTISSVEFQHDEAENIFNFNSIASAYDGNNIYVLRNGVIMKTYFKDYKNYYMKNYNITHTTFDRSKVDEMCIPDDGREYSIRRTIIDHKMRENYQIEKKLFSTNRPGEIR